MYYMNIQHREDKVANHYFVFLQVKSIVQSGVENPGNDNEIKKMQMMQLAQMNGTLRPQDIIFR